ncbi:MAG: DUF1573 domain-containing protein [Candidatus Uhrbacteria bacterium]|nr:DUF1573 domain-containing protein [Candidatus Uhrbacteria bacterium]
MKKKSKPYLWGSLVILILIVGFKVLSSSATEVAPVINGELTISESSWDLGDIRMADGMNTKSVSITNKTSSPITLTKMETSCMCTTAQVVHADGSKSGLKGMPGHGGGSANLSETIQAGETATLFVNFDPNAHGPEAIGPITRNVMMTTNSQAQPEIQLTFSGNVIK